MVKFVTPYNRRCTLTLQISTDKDLCIDPGDRFGRGGVEFPELSEEWKDWRICAVLAKQRSEKDAARITGGQTESENIVTGPNLDPAQWIIVVGEGQTLYDIWESYVPVLLYTPRLSTFLRLAVVNGRESSILRFKMVSDPIIIEIVGGSCPSYGQLIVTQLQPPLYLNKNLNTSAVRIWTITSLDSGL
jgi:hypothetical protein